MINSLQEVIPSITKERSKILLFFLLALVFFLLVANFYIYSNPKFSRRAEIKYYENLASQFPPSSIQAKRYQAIAEALRQGKSTYTFSASKVPALGGQ